MNTLKNHVTVLVLIFPIFSSCSAFAKDVIWQASNNEFLKFIDQDSSVTGPNDHPVALEANEIKASLDSLRIQEKHGHASKEAFKPVFTVAQRDILSRYLTEGLKNAKPRQDIIFAMERSVPRARVLKPNRYFVAGRVFYKDNRLNIIIGDYDRPRLDGYELAYDPTNMGIVRYNFDYGKRSTASKFDSTIIGVTGVENKPWKNTRRSDWLVIDVNVAAKAYDHLTKIRKEEELAKKRQELREVLGSEEFDQRREEIQQGSKAIQLGSEEIQQGSKEIQLGSEEIQQGGKEIQQGSEEIQQGSKEIQLGSEEIQQGSEEIRQRSDEIHQREDTKRPEKPTGSLEERLTVLKRLRSKDLITDEEYEMKRKLILDEL
ncbi:MAG: hypothetical protein ABF290_08635 [Thiogranum sp.]